LFKDEDIPYDFPFRVGNTWSVVIDLINHKILDWPQGRSASVFMKVRDEGTYQLLDAEQKIIGEIKGYVPDFIPNEHRDYIDLEIDDEGAYRHGEHTS
jgi:hypothetical protein